jgi:hypothetical protein
MLNSIVFSLHSDMEIFISENLINKNIFHFNRVAKRLGIKHIQKMREMSGVKPKGLYNVLHLIVCHLPH